MDFLDQLLTDFKSARVFVLGLPDLQNNQTYHFDIQRYQARWEVWLPGEYIGRDQNGDPSFAEQGVLLEKFKAEYKGQGGYTFDKDSDYENFLLAIVPFVTKVHVFE